jgi:hypothetical protein
MPELTLADHAEAWWTEQGNPLPPRSSVAWTTMYEVWIDYAFAGLTP